jgi:hypothetical protein
VNFRPNTVKSKLAEFLKKEDQLRKCVLFKTRERGGEGPRGRSPPSNFKLKEITFGGFIDEKNFSFHCNICGTTLTGRNESEKHLRTDHFESHKSNTRLSVTMMMWAGRLRDVKSDNFTYLLAEVNSRKLNVETKRYVLCTF